MSFICQPRMSSIAQLIADIKAHPYNDALERRRGQRFSRKGRPLPPKKPCESRAVQYICPDNEAMQERVKELCAVAAGCPVEMLTWKREKQFRRIFASVARSRGWSITLIGKCMELHHSTVLYMLRRQDRVAVEVNKVLAMLEREG